MQVANAADMHRFLNEYGDPGSHSKVHFSKSFAGQTVAGIKLKDYIMHFSKDRGHMDFSQFVELQRVLRRAGELSVEQWSKLPPWFHINSLKVDLNFEEGRLTGECIVPGVLACAAQLFVEKLSGTRYGWCARSDCNGKWFRHESNHARKYCSPECAHLVAVRASRERKQPRARKHEA
jgi:hypothetical protein